MIIILMMIIIIIIWFNDDNNLRLLTTDFWSLFHNFTQASVSFVVKRIRHPKLEEANHVQPVLTTFYHPNQYNGCQYERFYVIQGGAFFSFCILCSRPKKKTKIRRQICVTGGHFAL